MLGHLRVQRAHAIREVAVRRQTSDVRPRRAGCCESPVPCSARASRTHFVHRQRHAQDRVVAREAAVLAVVDALVGKVERREQADDFAEPLLRQRVRAAAHRFQQFARGRRNQRGEIAPATVFPSPAIRAPRQRSVVQRPLHQRRQRQRIEFRNKTHANNLAKRRTKSRRR